MKKIISVFALVLLVTAFLIGPAGDKQVDALSGCCKQRASYSSGWHKNGKSFDDCKKLNAGDKDNLFDESGAYWWDVNCR